MTLGDQTFQAAVDSEGRLYWHDYKYCWQQPAKEPLPPPAGPPEIAAGDERWERHLPSGISTSRLEFRSGRLIPGSTLFHPSGRSILFVPDLNAKVISFSDYRYHPKGRNIWNLPVAMSWRMRADARPDEKLEDLPKELQPGPEIGVRFPGRLPWTKPGREHYVSYFVGGKTYFGYLDETGTFVPDTDLPPEEGKPARPRFPDLFASEKADEPVFEFRSGRLIRGTLSKAESDGSTIFLPELGSHVVAYDPTLAELKIRRIYNLPPQLKAAK